jgi:Protein of unknown function (DUF3383)
MTLTLPISDIVNVTVSSSPTFPKRKGFGVLNIVGSSSRFVERSRRYGNMQGVAADFLSTDPEYLAAQVYYSQSPTPTELVISRRDLGLTPARLTGAKDATAAYFETRPITDPLSSLTVDWPSGSKLLVTVDGIGYNVLLTLAAATSLAGVANLMKQNIRIVTGEAPAPGAFDIIYDPDTTRFNFISPTVGSSSTITSVTSTDTDVTNFFGLDVFAVTNPAVTHTPGNNAVVTDIPSWRAITNGAANITVNGTLLQAVGMNFSAVNNMNEVAAEIERSINAAAPTGDNNVTVEFTDRFIVETVRLGASATITDLIASNVGSPPGFPVTTYMRGSTASDIGAIVTSPGTANVLPITAVLDLLEDYDRDWYGLSVLNATDVDIKASAAWCESRVKIYGYTSGAAGIIDPLSTTDVAAFLNSGLYSRTFGVYDTDDNYADVSVFARAFTVNFSEQNSTITLKFKQLPTITSEVLTESQKTVLVNKKINYYTKFGDSAMLAEGVMASGVFFDEKHGLDWLKDAVETEVFGYLYTRTTKVPQTDKGVAAIVSQVEKVMFEGVRNGLLAPGQWNGFDLGDVVSGDYLPKGFYIYAQPVASQSQSQREQRFAPPIQVICKGAGAIHFADISITFER